MKAKSYWLMMILVIAALAVSGIASAAGTDREPAEVMPSGIWVEVSEQAISSSPERLIAPTTSKIDKFIFKLKGCKILHELNDATALKCPKGIQIKGAVEDIRYYATDMDANIQINADDVWNMNPSITGAGVTVAVLDTGIDTNHPEFINSIAGGKSFVAYTTSHEDDAGHGTHVAGIITADGVGVVPSGHAKGVAPGAMIWAGKVLDNDGSGWSTDIAAAIEYVVNNDKADIISMSLGGGNYAGENCDGDYLASKVNWAVGRGLTVVVASGNNRFFVSSPACASGAIAVGAVDKDDKMAYFSNFGPALDIVAPGVSINSSLPDNDYASWSGTSMSTPHVSGTVALMLEANPGLTDAEIKTALYATANPINSEDSTCYGVVKKRGRTYQIGEVTCTSDNYGAGIVNAYAAVNYTHPVCGNNIIEGSEECDNSKLDGKTCQDFNFETGDLSCNTDCTFDTSSCSGSPQSCNDFCIDLELVEYSGGECKTRCHPRKETEIVFTCQNTGDICCCN